MDCWRWKKKNLCLVYQYMFYLSQGVPVMAIRNKMVLEGLDPNMLEWVPMIISNSCLHSCGFVVQLSRNWPITFPSLRMTAHLTPPCLTEERGAPRTKMLLPPALTANHLSVTDICPLQLQSFLQRPSVAILSFCGRALREREIGCSVPVEAHKRDDANKCAWNRRIQPEWL